MDSEGFLKRINDWSPSVGYILAYKEGCKLINTHWEIILLLRKFYETYKLSPNMVSLINELKYLNYKKGNSIYLLNLFNSYNKKNLYKKTNIITKTKNNISKIININTTKSNTNGKNNNKKINTYKNINNNYKHNTYIYIYNYKNKYTLNKNLNITINKHNNIYIYNYKNNNKKENTNTNTHINNNKHTYKYNNYKKIKKKLITNYKKLYVHQNTNNTNKKQKLYIDAESPARIAARIAGLPKPNNCM